jgi:hypothetical protein
MFESFPSAETAPEGEQTARDKTGLFV